VVIRAETPAKSAEKLIKLLTIKLSNPTTKPIISTKEMMLDRMRGNLYFSRIRLNGVNNTAKNAPKANGIRMDFPTIRINSTTINKDKTAKALR
jgi:hypothetical protein